MTSVPSGRAGRAMNRRLALVSATIVGFIAALLVVVLATRDPATSKVCDSPLIGKAAPALSGEGIDGSSFDLETYVNDFVLVNSSPRRACRAARSIRSSSSWTKARQSHKKGNRWYAVVYDGIDPETGKKQRHWVPAGTRRSGAAIEQH